jgi:type II secretory pathway pseudopilin PulG
MIETFTVFVMLSILALAAVPIYGKYARNSRVCEAAGRIGEIVTAARTFALHNLDNAGAPKWPPRAGGSLVDLSSSPNFTYSILSGAGANAETTLLQIQAKGREGTGMAGVTIEVTVPSIDKGGLPLKIRGL